MKLSVRFTIAALALAETSLLAALVLQQGLEKRHLERKQAESQQASVRRLARVAQDATLQQNELYFLNYLKVLKDSPEVSYAAFVDENGAIRLHSSMLDGADVVGKKWEPPPGDVEEIVKRGDRPIGAAHIGFDKAVLRAEVAADLAQSRRRLLWVFAGFSVLAWLGALALARGLASPLLELHEGARRLGAGELGHRINVARADELGDLAAGFNKMADELERINRLKEALMGSITHDLKSPLQAIQGHAQLLLLDAKASDAEKRQSAALIHENARRMAGMANDLTDLVKLQMDRLEVQRKPVKIGEAFESTRRFLDVLAKRLGVSIDVDAPPGLAPVSADPEHLQRVLTNLVSNALKFTPPGGRIALKAVAEPHHTKIVVSDTGKGISEEKLKTLFTRFIGTEGISEGRAGQADLGTGLGLSICRELVERHGGRIWAESEVRKGTSVFFTLPEGGSKCSAGC